MFRSLFVLSLAVCSALALVAPSPRSLPTGTLTCGSDKYSPSQVSAAVSQGYSDYQAGKTVGSDSYPHQFYDDEKLTLYCSGSTWYEFPIQSGSVYTGGSPGADRVIFNTSGAYCAVVTHTGASSYDGFVSCSGD